MKSGNYKANWLNGMKKVIRTGCMMLLFVLVLIGMLEVKTDEVRAAESQLYFEETKYSLYVGNTRMLCLNFEDETDVASQDDFWWYGGYFESSDTDVVKVDFNGKITCVGPGTATVTGFYLGMTASLKVKVRENKFKLSEDSIILYQGESGEVTLSGPRKAYSYEYTVWDEENRNQMFSDIICENNEKGKFTVTGYRPGKYNVYFIINARNGESYSKRCSVEVLQCGLTDNGMAVAVGKSEKIHMENAELVSANMNYCYSLERDWMDTCPININVETGEVTSDTPCTGYYSIDFKTPSGNIVTQDYVICITDPVYIAFEGYLWAGDSHFLAFEGLSNYSDCSVILDDGTVVYEKGSYPYIIFNDAGTYGFTIIADGVEFKGSAEVIKVEVPEKPVNLVKGKSKSVAAKGLPEGMKAKYSSSDTSIVKVNKNGKLTAKGYGSAAVTITVDTKCFTFAVNVGTKTGVSAVEWGLKQVGKAEYSQAKRMEDGYFDCSSFAWRCYAAAGKYLGGSTTYAPTAADLAKWMNDNDYVIEFGAPDSSQMLPGDLIFSTSGGDNGRYLKIDHVAVYSGADIYSGWFDYSEYAEWRGYDYGSELFGWIVHAGNSGGGIYTSPYPGYGNIVMTARPVKAE